MQLVVGGGRKLADDEHELELEVVSALKTLGLKKSWGQKNLGGVTLQHQRLELQDHFSLHLEPPGHYPNQESGQDVLGGYENFLKRVRVTV